MHTHVLPDAATVEALLAAAVTAPSIHSTRALAVPPGP